MALGLGYDGSTNQFTGGMGGIPADLQKVIDQVMGMTSTPPSGARGVTASQRALAGNVLGSVAGIAKAGMDIGAEERIAAERNKTTLEAQKISSTPGLMEAERKRTVIPGSGSWGLMGAGGASDTGSTPTSKWWNAHDFSMW